jgi:beta-lactamase superfamily II metal-dependent hydrolase
MSELVVRVYDVRFGDAVLVTIPDTENVGPVDRTILFDFGNALGTEGGQDDILEPVIDDIIARLGGKPLDLYVMTHEHLDHVQGLFHASDKFNKTIQVKQAWLTGSADPDYYKDPKHQDAKQKKIAADAAYGRAFTRAQALSDRSTFLNLLLANNNTRKTSECVTFLRTKLADPQNVHYVDRETDLKDLQPASPASSAKISLWAPEENTADYYGRFKPLAAGLGIDDTFDFDDLDGRLATTELARPPAGVDAGAFYNLLDSRHGASSTLLSIDRASNNTSIVMLIEWKGWKLLFAGDAEKRSWKQMAKVGVIEPVHFLKVSHHGSHTGMPPEDILEKLLPLPAAGAPRARAAVSTYPKTYAGVPDPDTTKELLLRVDLKSTRDLKAGELAIEIPFSSDGPP